MPQALPIISMAVAGAGILLPAYAAYESGQAQKRISEYNAKVLDNEAKQKSLDAQILANAERYKGEKLLARQRVLFAKSGVGMDTGSPLIVQMNTALQLERGAQEVERTGNVEANRYRQNAVIQRMQGNAAATAGKLQAFNSLLGSAGKIMGGFMGGSS